MATNGAALVDSTSGRTFSRDSVGIHPEDTGPRRDDDEEVRFYFDPEDPNFSPLPSVTSILQVREDPEKDESIQGWRDHFDGSKPWKRPWWKDSMAFKGARGTLVHFAILSQLGDPDGDTYHHQVGGSSRGYEEYWAEYKLKKWSKQAPSADNPDVPTPANNEYDGEHAWDVAMRDTSWAIRQFKNEWQARGLDDTNVIDVERYVFDTEYGYAGQVDLLYEDANGDVVCADLKTSSAIRISAKLQLAAYANAVAEDVDRLECWWLYPDDSEFAVESHEDWERTWRGLEHEFLGLCDTASVTYSNTLSNTTQTSLLDSDDDN